MEVIETPISKVSIQWWVAEAINDRKSDRLGVSGGYGSSKSYGGWQWLYDRIESNQDCKAFLWVSPTYKLLKESVIPNFEEFASSIGLIEKLHYTILRGGDNLQINFLGTKQRVLLKSANKPDSLVAFTVGFAVYDEPGLYAKEAFGRLASRVRFKLKKGKNQVLFTGTPEGLGNYFSDKFDSDNSPDGWLMGWDERDNTKKIITENGQEIIYRRFVLDTEDNPFLSDSYISALYEEYGFNENYIKSYLFGRFAPFATGLAAPSYSPRLHDVVRVHADPNKELLLSFDFNANPVTWITAQESKEEIAYKEYEKVLNIIDEAELGYGTLEEALIEFEVKYPIRRFRETSIVLYGDCTGYHKSHKTSLTDYHYIKAELEKKGYKNISVKAWKYNPQEAITIDNVNRLFTTNRIYVNNDLKRLKRSLVSTELKENERKLKKPASEDWTHPFDALKYLCIQHWGKSDNTLKGLKW